MRTSAMAASVVYEPAASPPAYVPSLRFQVWLTAPEQQCHVMVGAWECSTPTPYVIVYTPATLALRAPTKRLPICPECASDLFGLDVALEALRM